MIWVATSSLKFTFLTWGAGTGASAGAVTLSDGTVLPGVLAVTLRGEKGLVGAEYGTSKLGREDAGTGMGGFSWLRVGSGEFDQEHASWGLETCAEYP